MEATIRQATADDAPALAELAAVTFPLACPPDSPAAEISAFVAANLSTQAFAKYLADPSRILFVAEETAVDGAGHLLAYTMLVDSPPSDADVAAVSDPDAVELSKCYAHPDVHGGSISRDIMQASLGWITEHGNRQAWLGVNSENLRAQRFYGKHGFSVAGTRSFQLGKRVEHDYVMVRPGRKSTTG
ncbi:N-acetyltransferase [Arthrobacter sp. LAPM80]|uniref:GNAT family N-acetyltransferase n=1 Tax=Arthrobacter sp. LAPM80 TaxID=3141788 RepID=UPI00398AC7AC